MIFPYLPLTAFTRSGSSPERQVPTSAKNIRTVLCSVWPAALPSRGDLHRFFFSPPSRSCSCVPVVHAPSEGCGRMEDEDGPEGR